MRNALVVSAVVCLSGCKFLSPDLVSIDPEYSYVDGCTTSTVQGHHLGTSATGAIGGESFLSLTAAEEDPSRPEHAQDVGFLYTAVVPPSPTGEPGFFDVTLTVDGEELSIKDGFYYVTCPGSLYIENYDPAAAHAAGDTILLTGCGIDPASTGRLLDSETEAEVATFSLTEVCGSAQVSFTAPQVAAGTYIIEITHPDSTVFGGACPPADTADTGAPCVPITFTVQ